MGLDNEEGEFPIEELISSLKFIKYPKEVDYLKSISGNTIYLKKQVVSMDKESKRILLIGNEHSDIVSFMRILSQIRKDLKPPFSITNFDEHTDDSGYYFKDIANGRGLNASWQRYFTEIGITNRGISYNVLPSENASQISTFATEMGIGQYSNSVHPQTYRPQILSVDLDFFNHIKLHDDPGKLTVKMITDLSEKSEVTMVFFSPTFSTNKSGREIVKKVFQTSIKDPVDPRNL